MHGHGLCHSIDSPYLLIPVPWVKILGKGSGTIGDPSFTDLLLAANMHDKRMNRN